MEDEYGGKDISILPPVLQDFSTFLLSLLPEDFGYHLLNVFWDIFPEILRTIRHRATIAITEPGLSNSVATYLSDTSFAMANNLTLFKAYPSGAVAYTLAREGTLVDKFEGFDVEWHCSPGRPRQLSFPINKKKEVHAKYIPHVLQEAARVEHRERERKLYSNWGGSASGGTWTAAPLSHPATFDALALDPGLKKDILDDLARFETGRAYYARVGRAWKRGYLMYGPPGTGKTTLVAAIANFLMFDVYSLDLSAVWSLSHLKKLLISTSDKSVVVIEDIDRPAEQPLRRVRCRTRSTCDPVMSLSRVLDCMHRLWSSYGVEQRVVIFTTSCMEKLDNTLLRPGRLVDRHVYLGYCGFEAFKTLTRNHLGIKVEEALPSANMTPAEIVDILMAADGNPDRGMVQVVESLRSRRPMATLVEEDMEARPVATEDQQSTRPLRMEVASHTGDTLLEGRHAWLSCSRLKMLTIANQQTTTTVR